MSRAGSAIETLKESRPSMISYEPWELKLALQAARQVRTCPPDRLLRVEPPHGPLLRHQEICPFCADECKHRDSLREPFHRAPLPHQSHSDELMAVTRPTSSERETQYASAPLCLSMAVSEAPLKAPTPVSAEPRPGEVWVVDERLEGWGPDDFYYSAPRVLVLQVSERTPGIVRVAQVYDDIRLMGPGDVPLSSDAGMPGEAKAAEGFAESWNVYALRAKDLRRRRFRVPDDVLRAVCRAAGAEARLADDETEVFTAVVTAFRRMEIQVGAFFAMQSIHTFMNERERSFPEMLEDQYPDPGVFESRGPHSGLRPIWPERAVSTVEAAVLARFPEDALPLAAASRERTLRINLLEWGEGEMPVNFRPSIATLTLWEEDAEGLLVGGVAAEAPWSEAEIVARWELPDGTSMEPEEARIDPSGGFFRIRFRGLSDAAVQQGRLAVLLCVR